jgi:hypothetical protein
VALLRDSGMNLRDDRPAKAGAPPPRRPNYLKLGFVLLIGLYGVLCALSPSTYRFLDRVDLVFHLNWDPALGNLVYLVGFAALIASVLGGLYYSLEEERDSG